MIRFPFFKGACNLLPPPEMEGNARLLEGNNQFIFTSNTGRKNGFTNVCERCKYVVNLELQICTKFALSAKVWANTYIC